MSEQTELVISRRWEQRRQSRTLGEDFNRARQLPPAALARLGGAMLGALASKAMQATAVLDHLPKAVVLIDRQAEVLLINRKAESLFAKQDGLALQEGQLVLARCAQARLANLLAYPAAPHALRSARTSGMPDYLITVSPIEVDAATLYLLTIDDPAVETPCDVSLLADLYELTPAQCRLTAVLLRGATLAECAGEMGVSLATVKAHLRELFQKTGANRQADLIRLFSRVLTFSSSC